MSYLGIPICSFLIKSTKISLFLHYPKTELSIKSSTLSLSSTTVGPYSNPHGIKITRFFNIYVIIRMNKIMNATASYKNIEIGFLQIAIAICRYVTFANFIRNRDFSCSLKTENRFILVDMERETMILKLTTQLRFQY